jgi:uridine kinase
MMSIDPDHVSHRQAIDRIMAMNARTDGTCLVAIDGHGAAGKSTLARQIASELNNVAIVCLDDFGQAGVVGWDRRRFRAQVLDPLLSGQPGRYQRWDWDSNRLAEWHDVPTGGIVIVEGVSSTRVELGTPWHLTIWVDAPEPVRLQRGIVRDGESMRDMWERVWIPGENAYVASQSPQTRADLVIDGCEGGPGS